MTKIDRGVQIADCLRAYRQKHDMSQRMLADMLQISLRSLQDWEQNRPCVNGQVIYALLRLDPAAVVTLMPPTIDEMTEAELNAAGTVTAD